MDLRRHSKGGRKTEAVHSSAFVAFWSDAKAIIALDRQGVEWKLAGRVTLRDIEGQVTGFARAHRRALVLVSAVDRLMSRADQAPEHFCVVLGREFPVSHAHKSSLQYQYRARAAQHGFSSLGLAVAA